MLLPKPICIHAALLLVVMSGGLEDAGRKKKLNKKKNGENNQKAVRVEMSFPLCSPLLPSTDTLNTRRVQMCFGGKVISDNQLCLLFLDRFTLIYIIPCYISVSGLEPLDLSLCHMRTCDIVVNVFVS